MRGGSPARTPTELWVPREATGARLDRFLAGSLGVSRSELQRWIERGLVTVGGASRAASGKLREGEHVVVRPDSPASTTAEPDAAVQFGVLHVDDDIVVLDKPAGLVVHPARGHENGTLVNGLLARGFFPATFGGGAGEARDTGDAQGASVGEASAHRRPGIVHRLDKGTSGVMVVARNALAREHLKAQFQAHAIARAYEALVVGVATSRTFSTMHGRHPHDRLRFTTRVTAGKHAVTHVRVLAALRGATHVECTLETGRTHQIRVHLAESGTPVLGDPVYGKTPRDPDLRAIGEGLGHQALHARLLGLIHPRTGAALRFEVPPPAEFAAALAALRAV